MSSTTTSGASSLGQRRAPRAPFDASPTTVNPGSPSSTWRIPLRTIAWSSATSDPDGRARHRRLRGLPPAPAPRATPRRPGRPVEPHAPAERADPLAHARQPHVALRARDARGWRRAGRGRRRAPRAGRRRRPTLMPTSTVRACAWRRTFDSASCSARNSASSASLESGGSAAGAASSIRTPLRAPKSATSERSAGSRPRSSSSEGRRSLVTLRMLRMPVSISAERVIQPLRLLGRHAVPEHAQLHLHGGEHLGRLVVQLAREPPALLLVLLDHAGRQAGQLDGAGLEPGVEVGVLQRRADLLAQRDQEPVVERGERIARVADQHQRADHLVPPKQRQHRRVGKWRRRRSPARLRSPAGAPSRARGPARRRPRRPACCSSAARRPPRRAPARGRPSYRGRARCRGPRAG